MHACTCSSPSNNHRIPSSTFKPSESLLNYLPFPFITVMASGSSSSSSLPQTPDDSASVSKPESPSLENLQLYLWRHKDRMYRQGLLDQNFTQLEMLEARTPGFEADFIQGFFRDAERIFTSSDSLLDEERTNFLLLDTNMLIVQGTSVSIGCPTIERACIKFREFCELHDKQGCIGALHQVKCEFYRMKENLNYILEVNEKIKRAEEEDNSSSSE